MSRITVVADYRRTPSEGIQVVSKTLIEGLRAQGHHVDIIDPVRLLQHLPGLIARRPRSVVFTHGPGRGVVMATAALRRLTRARVIWVATRPDLGDVPRPFIGRRTAHAVVCNRPRPDLRSVASDATFVQQFIGIDPHRVRATEPGTDPWPELRRDGRPIALHVGHLRPNRGLDLLAEAKRRLTDRLEIVVQGSPNFPADPVLLDELESAGVHVRRGYVENLGDLYRAADLYLFPTRNEASGAIELPLSVLEAVAVGCPVLTSEFGALPEALDGCPNVTTVPTDDFVDALAGLVANPEALRRSDDPFPDHLRAERVTDAVLRSLEAVR